MFCWWQHDESGHACLPGHVLRTVFIFVARSPRPSLFPSRRRETGKWSPFLAPLATWPTKQAKMNFFVLLPERIILLCGLPLGLHRQCSLSLQSNIEFGRRSIMAMSRIKDQRIPLSYGLLFETSYFSARLNTEISTQLQHTIELFRHGFCSGRLNLPPSGYSHRHYFLPRSRFSHRPFSNLQGPSQLYQPY